MIKRLKSKLHSLIFLAREFRDILKSNKLDAHFIASQASFYDDYWQQIATSTNAQIEHLSYGYYRLSRGGKSTYVKGFKMMLNDPLSHDICGHKPLTYQLLNHYGYGQYIPEHEILKRNEVQKAVAFLRRIGKPIVVKPAYGTGGGVGITVGVNNIKQLKKSILLAGSYCQEILVEQLFNLTSYRLLYYKGLLIDAVKREPPILVGDGEHTIKHLIELENQIRKHDHSKSLVPLHIDLDCELALAKQKLNLNSVPLQNHIFQVKTAINENSINENTSVLTEIHKEVVNLGTNIVSSLNIELAGLDLMTSDITKPLQETHCIINEINTKPGLHFHCMIANQEKSVNVGKIIVDDLLS